MASMLSQLQSWFGIAGSESPPPTMSPIILPTCPPSYDYFTTYQTGSLMSSTTITSSSNDQETIYKCQYQKYCNIFTPNRNWNETEYTYWNEAWVELGSCLVQDITDEPTSQPTSLSPITNKPTTIPACPTPYNSTRTNYIPNERIEVHSNILTCQSQYVKYCNIHTVDRNWNTEEREKWNIAWKFVGPCLKEVDDSDKVEGSAEVEEVDESVDEGLLPSLPAVETDNPIKRPSLRPTTHPSSSPISSPTESPSHSPSTESPTTTSPSYNPTPLQYCPPSYNPRYAKRNKYKIGDLISVNNYIYQCRAGSLHPGSDEPYDLYEIYCNMNNEDMKDLNANEKMLYDLAWEPISYCYVTDTPTLLPTITPSGNPTTGRPSSMPTDEPSKRPTSHPTTQPTKYPSSQPTNIPSIAPTLRSRSPIGQYQWYPDVESNIKQCIYGNDYPEFMILNSNRDNFLFDTEEDCCEYHNCIVKKVAEGEEEEGKREEKKREYWYPNVESNDRECIYNSEYSDWMMLSTNRPNFIFTSQEECCIQHDCPIMKTISEYWYPNLLVTNEERECIHDSSYQDWMALEVNAPNFLFTSEEECCIKHDCIKQEYWYLDIESSTNECKHGYDFPEWMALEVNAPKFLFASQQECCIEHECKSMYFFPEVYTDVKECIYSSQYPDWMKFRSSHYLFTSEMACCEVHECEERYWYPNLLSTDTKKDCLYDSNFEPWMASATNSHVFLFDSREGCCNRHGCDDTTEASSPYRPYRNTPMPSRQPSRQPSRLPTRQPSRLPTRRPSRNPTRQPTALPTIKPTLKPTVQPTAKPTNQPSNKPSQRPSSSPTLRPQQIQACPNKYDSSLASTYTAGSQVEVNSIMYQCRGSLYSFYCSKTMYQPQSTSTPLWSEAWEDLGPCSLN